MATEIYVCLDLGNDTLKISFAYEHGGEEVFGKLMMPNLINQVALPASASYDEETRNWEFAEALEASSNKNFANVVKIKSLLSLVVPHEDEEIERRNKQYYEKKNFFPKFSFPNRRKMNRDFQYMVDQKQVFEDPKCTPRQLCKRFFQHARSVIKHRVKELADATGINFSSSWNVSIVYPPKQGAAYVDELKYLVRFAFDRDPVKILTSTQALGLFAFHRGLIAPHERVLVFDMGDESVSVTKAWLNPLAAGNSQDDEDNEKNSTRLGILIDGQEGHSAPLSIGGSDIDESIASFLEGGIHDRETVGSPSVDHQGHIYENGLCSDQYLMMKDIKKAKMVMPMVNVGIFRNGVPISVHREILVQRLLTEQDFRYCVGIGRAGGIADQVSEYILQEIERPVNQDVSKILFAGGMIETKDLLEYLSRILNSKHPELRIVTFDGNRVGREPYALSEYDNATYAASVGGAIVALKDYSVDAVLSYSYGTWLYHERSSKKHLSLFANRGSLLTEDKNIFSISATFDVDKKEQDCLAGDEVYSTIIDRKGIRERAYAGKVTYEGEWLIVGEEGDNDRKKAEKYIDLQVVGGGKESEVRFFYHGARVSLSSYTKQALYFEEGFVVDRNGNATPFFRNPKDKNNVNVRIRRHDNNSYLNVNARDVEFVLYMGTIPVPVNI